ncbi:MAG: hypothetical protein Q9212_003373 [Teloschistes hypoglaucus]
MNPSQPPKDPTSRPTYTPSQLHDYLESIQHSDQVPSPSSLSLEYLTTLQQHHLATYPFENLSIHYSPTHSVSLDLNVLYDKFVRKRRGGYCMEQNAFFGTVLRSLGYEVTNVGGRVCDAVNGGPGLRYGSWSHMINIVTISFDKYMVDVGFGGDGATAPILLEDGTVNPRISPSEMRLVKSTLPEHTDRTQEVWIYQVRSSSDAAWSPIYSFTETEFFPQDYEMMNFWTSTSRYGNVVRVGPNTVDVADGAALGPIYVDKGGFPKTSHYHNFYVDGFPTMFSSTDPAYRASKAKLVAPLFSNAAIRQGSHIINQCVDRFVTRLQEARESSASHSVELQEHARLLGLDVLASYLFRRPHPAITEKAGGSDIVLPWLNAFVDIGQFYYVPTRCFGYLVSMWEKRRPDMALEAESANAIQEYAMSLSSDVDDIEGSFQGRLLGHGFSKEEVAAESKDLTFAGVHSFGSVLATTLWYLAKDTALHDGLRDEILQSRGSELDTQHMALLQGVVKEGLRLAPANGTRFPRIVSSRGWNFEGYYFPPGTIVGVSAPQLLLNEKVFPDATIFRPERWLKPSAEMQRDFIPFSVGIRQCIAKSLAMAELTLAVKKVVESDILRDARPAQDKIEVWEWFNVAVKGNRIELLWAADQEK